MTSHEIQFDLFRWCNDRGHRICAPNFYLCWECDLWTVTRAGLGCEFEVKLTLDDFRADRKKVAKHEFYGALHAGQPPPRPFTTREAPSRFYYVVPTELQSRITLPSWAGLIVHDPSKPMPVRLSEVQPAPRLHRETVPNAVLLRAGASMMHRYWAVRTKLRTVKEAA